VAHQSAYTTCYLAETFAARRDSEQLRVETERVRAAAEALASSGVGVRHLESLFLPGEEMALHLFEAERPDAIEQVLRDAGLEADRISLVIAVETIASAAINRRPSEKARTS